MREFTGRDFLTLQDFTRDEIIAILDSADEYKAKLKRHEPHDSLRGKTVAMIFEKHSTRTRLSFLVAGAHLGITMCPMEAASMQLARGESIPDTARVIDQYCDALVIRSFEQRRIEEFAAYMTRPVINGLTNERHPLQLLADLQTIREKKGRLHDLKIGFVGDVWNMAYSWGIMSAIFGLEMNCAIPKGYAFDRAVQEWIDARNKETGGSFSITHNLRTAMSGVDIVVGVTFTSMQRTKVSEDENRKKLADFMPFQINADVMSWAKQDAVFMHCLPARRGEEVTDEVIDGANSVVFEEAGNRLHTAKALLALLLGEGG